MDFIINSEELAALYGLSHIQQLTYIRGVKPYMDIKTGLVGIKRRISLQSISEQLYVEPHQGMKSQSLSRDQVRRAIAGLARAGIVSVQSKDMQLILKCELASRDYCVQNKAAINPPQQAAIAVFTQKPANIGLSTTHPQKADIAEPAKAATPLNNNYLYFLFEKFWERYPQKKSKPKAQAVFIDLYPDTNLFESIMQGLHAQINHDAFMKASGQWVPAWKYPAKWLAERCWEDEITVYQLEETHHAKCSKDTKKHCAKDPFAPPTEDDETVTGTGNIIQLQRYRESR